MNKYSDNNVREERTLELLNALLNTTSDQADAKNNLASLYRVIELYKEDFYSQARFDETEKTKFEERVMECIFADGMHCTNPLPFSGSYTVYKKGDGTIPDNVQERLYEPFDEVLVCNKTEAYITRFTQDVQTVKYWTVATNQDVTGTLEECISFLQKELN